MGKFLRAVVFVVMAGALGLALWRTDNPASAIFQAREARSLGFLAPGEGATGADLPAFRSARDRCRVEARVQVEAGLEGCRLCVIKDCLETEGARFRVMKEMAPPP
ncbi:MAG: hypothetical protein Q8R92_12630 [Deltaproteobacteria bacterium]|nr:hypothetical protein [Deltaproteobacteria bacterium]